MFFTGTTILGWAYYSERCLEFLVGTGVIKPFRLVWVAVVGFGAVAAGTVFRLTRSYDFNASELRAGE